MKRFIFSVCALAAVVVGCTKSEVINRPHAEEPIQFSPYLGRIPVTKGTAADLNTLGEEGFQVYAFRYPEGQGSQINYGTTPHMDKVVKNLDGNGWIYSGNAYWPESFLLKFIAYGLNTGNLVTTDATQKNIINYQVPNTVAEQKDLLVAKYLADQKYDETAQNPGTVNFTFSHLLSRIGFSLVTKVDGTLVSVEQVDITGNFYSAGQVDLANAQETTIMIGETEYKQNRPFITPTGTAASTTYSLLPVSTDYTASFTSVGAVDGAPIYDNSMLWVKDYGEKTDSADDDAYVSKFPKSETEKDQHDVNATGYDTAKKAADDNLNNRYMMIIPVKGTEHNAVLKVKYFLPGAGSFASADINLSTIDFEPGKSYDFKLKVSTNGIKFEVSVESWDETMHDPENNPIFNLN